MDLFYIPLINWPDFASPEVWISLLTLTFLEIVLGVDNIIFITISANKLDKKDRGKAMNIGLALALVFRILLLFGISYLIAMQSSLFSIDLPWFSGGFTGQSIVLVLGGLFLIYKATKEIHHKLEGDAHDAANPGFKKVAADMLSVIIQISLINIVFSFDSILTAVGLTDDITIMVIAVVVSIGIMMAFAKPVGDFVNTHPTFQMLGLAFLILIGFMLIAEGAHLSHVVVAGAEIGTVPKGYLYFAIAFSLGVEVLNMKLRKGRNPVQLHGAIEDAKKLNLDNEDNS